MRVLDCIPGRYQPAVVHGGDRDWPESNCYVDLLLEIVHALGLEPRACLAFTLASDFEGDQWTFYKPPHGDLVDLYGLRIEELTVWRPVLEHVVGQVEGGRLPLVEVDAFYLPDTAQTDYRRQHTKTTIGVNAVDLTAERLEYFHNVGYYALDGDDFRGIFRLDRDTPADWLAPYCEILKVDRAAALPADRLVELSLERLGRYLALAPERNPLTAYGAAVEEQLGWVVGQDESVYHAYVFATLRQCGSCFEHAALLLDWLEEAGGLPLGAAAREFRSISATAKMLVMKTARMAARGRSQDVTGQFEAMAGAWQAGMTELSRRLPA